MVFTFFFNWIMMVYREYNGMLMVYYGFLYGL